ncbi:hypothetical protein CEXT_635861 [Caerostris extrusa]|uniref:Uncharacterized protein n=1 Tax=Caerostris extrusa TaxID=172846 RepID=A0AAV4XMN4_CAEEX|nr:hypothetical protein CEXT_635861 [Caerostris extrusa]
MQKTWYITFKFCHYTFGITFPGMLLLEKEYSTKRYIDSRPYKLIFRSKILDEIVKGCLSVGFTFSFLHQTRRYFNLQVYSSDSYFTRFLIQVQWVRNTTCSPPSLLGLYGFRQSAWRGMSPELGIRMRRATRLIHMDDAFDIGIMAHHSARVDGGHYFVFRNVLGREDFFGEVGRK